MGVEIERKFLVTGHEWRIGPRSHICQGYLTRSEDKTVRVRVVDERGFLTIKGPRTGAMRAEWEYPIPLQDARALLTLCEQPLLEKIRYRVEHKGVTWDVDEFLGKNCGLILAEVELLSEDQHFDKPDWIGDEVTYDERFYSSNL